MSSTSIGAVALLLIDLAGLDPGRVDRATAGGLAYLASVWDGQSYRDPYLQYVYPAERLRSPIEDWPLTYRRIDAYVDLLLLERAMGHLGPVEPHLRAAKRILRRLPEAWRGSGIHNTTRDPDPDGIGLDTYCIVGWINEDRGMARVVSRHRDGLDWIPLGFYSNADGFRKLADESWCIRLLGATTVEPGLTAELVPAHLRRALDQMRREPRPDVRAYLAIHALEMLVEAGGPGRETALRELLGAAIATAEEPSLRGDLLLQANLLDVCARAGGRAVRSEAARMAVRLLEGQGEDGGWPSRLGETGPRLRSFTTLRALIALGRLRSLR